LSERPWKLVLAAPVSRNIERLPEKYATAIVEILPALAANPKRLGKPLRFELEGRWAARRGPYRIVYALDEQARTVKLLAVAHRADAYRRR
jgi:mRNA-degrading endonuclease RelE of RelBE toxin-antitoxin system